MKRRISKEVFILIGVYSSSLMLLLFCAGCNRLRGELFPALDKPLVWPAPPEKGRIRYVGAISTEADLKKEVSWSEGFNNVLFGRKKIGVLLTPYAVAVDRRNRLIVSDTAGAVVHIFDMNTREYKQFSSISKTERLLEPVGLAIVDNQIYVVDSALHKVCVFDKDGGFRFSFGRERFSRPTGIAYNPSEEKVYVADTGTHVIDVFTKNGKFIDKIGARGSKPGMFNFPTHLWVDSKGKLYVCDTLNYRIQIFSSDGRFLETFGTQGDTPGNFAHPCAVATDSYGNIYVTDRQFENVQIFDSNGRILMAFGHEGDGLGQFWLPAGIYISPENKIYVADSFNKRVQIFELLETTNNGN